jgi:hypothetical protein
MRFMHAGCSAHGVGGFKSFRGENSDSDDRANFEAFDRFRAEIPYSPVLQELHRKGNAECHYRRNLNGISDSDSNSDTSPERPRQKTIRKDIRSLSAGAAVSRKPYDSPSSKDATEVEYATEWYEESPERPSLSPATKKRNHDELEAEMEDMTSMSESEIQAEMDEQVRKNQEADRKFMEYRRNTQGEVECGFRCESSRMLSDILLLLCSHPAQHCRRPSISSSADSAQRPRCRGTRARGARW